jgi:cytochrome c biogenesis protein CcmG/thiol:disulfide interchange protein DsbE
VRRLLGLAAVLVLLGVALVLGTHRPGSAPAARPSATALTPALRAAQAAAALPACPAGLTTALPALTLPCYAGGADVVAARAPGRPTVVNLWATWCGPCVDEVPELVAFAGRAGAAVGVVGVATEDAADSVYAFARTFKVNYPLVRDDNGDVLHAYGNALPVTLLVRADGTVADVHRGAYPTVAALQDAVATHLGVRV